ncbi:Conidiation-specific protein 10 (fragment) [uncultured Stenotrophomonas sp.]|uniref:Conidiation-specific protein 10 n=1 Tax=uncultured Stenotrophomonas sp. TaxID=165438 RepID=A0A1Y5QAY5_9GAMM
MANQNRDQNNEGRGFAGMDERKQREIADEGGKAVHAGGNTHEFGSEQVREAGRKGGQASGNHGDGRDEEE